MFENMTVKSEYEDVTEWSFNFLISIAKTIQDWKSIHGEYPATVSISRKSYERLCASDGLWYWFDGGDLTEVFHGVKIVVLEWDGDYFSMRGRKK